MRPFLAVFDKRVRGVRLIELIGLGLALAMIFWVCLSKAREGEDIKRMSQLDQQISEETETVSALKIKVAQLERPSRLEALATAYLGMKPVESTHEARIDNLGEISHAVSRPVAASAPAQATVAPAPAGTLISAGSHTGATPAPVTPVAAAMVPVTGQKAGGEQ